MALRLPQINRLWILLFVAVVLGLLATWLAVNYLKAREKRIAEEMALRAKGGPTMAVVVPVRALPRGSVIDDKAVAGRDIAADLVYEDMITADQYDKVAGRRLLRPVERGRPLRRADLFDVRAKDFSDEVDEGLRAITLDIDELNSIAQMLRPGNFVDLYLIASEQGGSGQEVIPVLERVKVVATGQTLQAADDTGPAPGQRAPFTTVTLEVTPEEAARIALAQQSGKIRAVLRNAKDETSAEIGTVNTASLRRGPRVAGRAEGTVEYIIGGKSGGAGAAAPVNINVPGLTLPPGVSIPGVNTGQAAGAAAPAAGLPPALQGLPPSIQSGIPSGPPQPPR